MHLVAGATAYCGDSILNGDESCDDGNTVTEAREYGDTSCEVCSDTCELVAGAISLCGDSVISGAETCDDGNTVTETCDYGPVSCEVCNAVCAEVAGVASYCGDGFVDSGEGEVCDDGGPSALCDALCQPVTSFISVWRTTAVNETITLPLVNGFSYSFTVDWGDSTSSEITYDDADRIHTYAAAGDHTITIDGLLEAFSLDDTGTKTNSYLYPI